MKEQKYNCLVVDDEPIARKIIINYIQQLNLLQISGECINALEVIDHLQTHDKVDIIFLDINMPNLSGLQLLKILQPQQPVIFTTAYSEYAVESYEVKAVDYLLKPFSFERFTKAVYKAIDVIQLTRPTTPCTLFIKANGKSYPVLVDDIVYCEAMKNYTMVQLLDGRRLMPLCSLSKFEDMVGKASGDLLQVHRSFLVSKKHISTVTASVVNLGEYQIPIGIQFKDKFLQAIGMKIQ